ncbi:hypothetical protein [Oricola cellulosilytica]|uniref:Uncharacterized protein n=1 Tax=Oricola cellulosilytica TaxID=1429082 RepID=A0A4R0P553_9HYPH|nr:hypothetical protein [Oricola cellulosilytica]TCD10942.1 hypothetical protein E0D97_17750 [Oricola cellulosilytica]
MSSRTNFLFDLARIMIRQARLLKAEGLISEAKAVAKRAVEINHMGHAAQLQPVRIRTDRAHRR